MFVDELKYHCGLNHSYCIFYNDCLWGKEYHLQLYEMEESQQQDITIICDTWSRLWWFCKDNYDIFMVSIHIHNTIRLERF